MKAVPRVIDVCSYKEPAEGYFFYFTKAWT